MTSFIIYANQPTPIPIEAWGHINQLDHEPPPFTTLWVWTRDFGFAYFPMSWLKYRMDVMSIPTPSVNRPLSYVIPYDSMVNYLRTINHLEQSYAKEAQL